MREASRSFMPYPFREVKHANHGPLNGLTFAVKDLFDVAGYPTGGGNPHILALSGVKKNTAPAVQQLLDAGARFVGKTHTNELAFSMSGHNIHYGTPRNGAAPDRIPGGSSSGSASAVSNGLCDIALGTDTGGSVRTPASYCGLFGLRPTHGRISLQGCQSLAPSMDTCGFFASTAEHFAAAAKCLLGEDRILPAEIRLISDPHLFSRLPTESQQALTPVVHHIRHLWGEITPLQELTPQSEELFQAFRVIQGYEAWQAQGRTIERYGLSLGPDVAARFEFGRGVTESDYHTAVSLRQQFTSWWEQQLAGRILVLPTVPEIAPLLTASTEQIEATRKLSQDLLIIAVMTGAPQVTVPMTQVNGSPLGISFLGPRGSDQRLIEMAVTLSSGEK